MSLHSWANSVPALTDSRSQQWFRLLHSQWPYLAFFSNPSPEYLKPLIGHLFEGDAHPLVFALDLRQGLVDLCIELDLPEYRFTQRWQQFWQNASFDGAQDLINS